MKYLVTLNGRSREVEVRQASSGLEVRLEGEDWQPIEAEAGPATAWRHSREGRRYDGHVALDGEDVFAVERGFALLGTVVDPREHALEHASGDAVGALVSAMPGAVVRVQHAVGDEIHEGEVVVVVEAMKMENEFKAPFDARLTSVSVEVGQAIEAGTVLAMLEPIAAD